MNIVTLIGNIATDIRSGATSGGSICSRFNLAVSDRIKDDKRTYFIPIVTFGVLAENVGKYCSKGNKVAVSGKLVVEPYEANDGTKRTSVNVFANEVEFLQPKSDKSQYEQPQMRVVPESEAKDLPF